VDPAKVALIVNLPPPKLVRQLRETLGTYRLLQEVYKGVCTNCCTNGKIVEEGNHI
jgi:hypothetical protein